jgi:hypothetical protein
MVLAPLQKLEIKYELSYQSTTRLQYIDKFDQLLIIQQWTSTVDNTVRSLIHFTIFIKIDSVTEMIFFSEKVRENDTRKMTSRTRKTSYVAFQTLQFEKVRQNEISYDVMYQD